MAAHLTLTQAVVVQIHGPVPEQICRMMSAGADTGLENRGQQRCCGDRHLRPAPNTFLAQLAEQRSFKPQGAGSSPAGRTICTNGGTGIRARLRIWCPSRACEFDSHFVHHIWENARVRSNGADCKSVAVRLRWFKSNFSHHKGGHFFLLFFSNVPLLTAKDTLF